MSDITNTLSRLLADSYCLYLKTQNYHWNVTGPQFKSLHDLFQEQYEDLSNAIDSIAERIRQLGEKAPGSFAKYSQDTSISEANDNANAVDMVKDLASSQENICKTINSVLKAAEKANDEVTTDLCIGRLEVHEKNRWMLNSSL